MKNAITDELILRSVQRATTPREEARLAAWRAADPENEARYRQVAHLWELRELVDPASEADPPVAGRELRARAASSARTVRIRPAHGRGSRRRLALAAAAGLAGLVAAGSLGVLLTGRGPTARLEVVSVAARGPEGSILRLSDGTVAHVGPEARVDVIGEDTARAVWVEGRVYFTVPPKSEPFVARTHLGEVRVLGTRFDMDGRPDGLELVVLDGAVELAWNAAVVRLLGGERAALNADHELRRSHVDDVFGSLDRLGSFVSFANTPLHRVARELERRFGIRVEIADPALASLTVTSWSSGQTPREIVSAICIAVGAVCSETGSTIHMAAGGAAPAGEPDEP